MRRINPLTLVALLIPAAAQPNVPIGFFAASSASYDSTIAPGSLFVIFGTNLGPVDLVKASEYPLRAQLAGTSISVVSGSTTLACPLFYSSAGVVAAILPSNTPPGTVQITVTYNGQPAPFPVFTRVAPSAVGIYTLASSGLGPGIFIKLDSSLNTFAAASKNGEVVTAWATGLGPISGPDDVVPATFPNFPGVEVFVGTQSAKVIYAGRSGCCAAVDQISFEIPPGVSGCYVPVMIRAGGRLSNSVSITANAAAGACSDSAPTLSPALVNRANAGQSIKTAALAIGPALVLGRAGFDEQQFLARKLSQILHTKVDPGDVAKILRARQAHNERAAARVMAKYAASVKALTPAAKVFLRDALNIQQEGAAAAFGQYSTSATLASALGGLFPSQGTCTILSSLPGGSGSSSRGLDAGASLALTGPAGSFTLGSTSTGQYQVMFGSSPAGPNVPPGTYLLKGSGGKGLGPFTATLNIATNVAWTNKTAISIVDRSQPLTISWSGGSGYVLLGGNSSGSEGGRAFVCVEDSTKGSFTIPSFVLSALSPTPTAGNIFIGTHPLSNPVQIQGVDLAYFMDGSSDSKSVGFR